jgi:acetyltransferase-like isoleucine patch superfamily enzyme
MFDKLYRLFAYLNTLPAKVKGMKIGKNSYLGPGYDFLGVQLKNIIINNNVQIGRSAWLQTIEKGEIEIGDNTNIGRRAVISAKKAVNIGKDCLLSYNVSILDHDHLVQDKNITPVAGKLTEGEAIIIGDECFIGANSCILKGVKLGKHCVVGANSVVTKSFDEYSVIAGNPAKFIKKITS